MPYNAGKRKIHGSRSTIVHHDAASKRAGWSVSCDDIEVLSVGVRIVEARSQSCCREFVSAGGFSRRRRSAPSSPARVAGRTLRLSNRPQGHRLVLRHQRLLHAAGGAVAPKFRRNLALGESSKGTPLSLWTGRESEARSNALGRSCSRRKNPSCTRYNYILQWQVHGRQLCDSPASFARHATRLRVRIVLRP
jgi:hypothetical protein